MTEEDLQQIEARCAAASPGPWLFETRSVSRAGGIAVADPTQTSGYRRIAYVTPLGLDYGGRESRGFARAHSERARANLERARCNGLFLAHARDDVPRLVAECRRLRAIVARDEQEAKGVPHNEEARSDEVLRKHGHDTGSVSGAGVC